MRERSVRKPLAAATVSAALAGAAIILPPATTAHAQDAPRFEGYSVECDRGTAAPLFDPAPSAAYVGRGIRVTPTVTLDTPAARAAADREYRAARERMWDANPPYVLDGKRGTLRELLAANGIHTKEQFAAQPVQNHEAERRALLRLAEQQLTGITHSRPNDGKGNNAENLAWTSAGHDPVRLTTEMTRAWTDGELPKLIAAGGEFTMESGHLHLMLNPGLPSYGAAAGSNHSVWIALFADAERGTPVPDLVGAYRVPVAITAPESAVARGALQTGQTCELQVLANTAGSDAGANTTSTPVLPKEGTYEVSEPGIVEVDASGTVRALAAGTARVSFVSGEQRVQVEFTVEGEGIPAQEAPVAESSEEPGEFEVDEGAPLPEVAEEPAPQPEQPPAPTSQPQHTPSPTPILTPTPTAVPVSTSNPTPTPAPTATPKSTPRDQRQTASPTPPKAMTAPSPERESIPRPTAEPPAAPPPTPVAAPAATETPVQSTPAATPRTASPVATPAPSTPASPSPSPSASASQEPSPSRLGDPMEARPTHWAPPAEQPEASGAGGERGGSWMPLVIGGGLVLIGGAVLTAVGVRRLLAR